jgi:putative aldouronate transport system substrate-binding protein
LEQNYWDYLDLIADWWAKGFIDMDFASNETSKQPAPYLVNPIAVTGGPDTKAQYAVFYSYAAQMTEIEKYGRLSPDGETFSLIAVTPPVKQAGDTVHFRTISSDAPNFYAVITDKCKNVPRVLEWFNYIYSDEGTDLLNFGVEGLSYEIVGGEKQFTDVIMNTDGYEPAIMKDLYSTGMHFVFYRVPTDFAYPVLDAHKLQAEAAWASNADGTYIYPEAADAFISQADTEKLIAEGTSVQMSIFMLFINHIMHGYADATIPYPMSPEILKAAFPQIEGWVAIKQGAYEEYLEGIRD